MNRNTLYLCGNMAILAVAAGLLVFSRAKSDSNAQDGEGRQQPLRATATTASRSQSSARTERRINERTARNRRRGRADSEQADAEALGAPVAGDASDSLEQLTVDILAQLQETVAARNFPRLQALLAELTSGAGSPFAKFGGVPVSVRKAMVEALASFGCGGLPELVGFLADDDPSVVQKATAAFQSSVSDFSLSDSERLPLLVAAAKVMTDGESLIGLMQNMTLLRNSLKVEAYLAIMESGTTQAQDAAKSKMKFLFDGAACDTVEDVEAILQAYPDGARDDLVYGGSKK